MLRRQYWKVNHSTSRYTKKLFHHNFEVFRKYPHRIGVYFQGISTGDVQNDNVKAGRKLERKAKVKWLFIDTNIYVEGKTGEEKQIHCKKQKNLEVSYQGGDHKNKYPFKEKYIMDIGEALAKPLKDIQKLVIGTVVAIIPIVNLIIGGYGLENARKPKELPEFDWVNNWVHGLLAAVIYFVYMLIPMILVYIILRARMFEIMTKGLSAAKGLLGYGIIALIILLIGAIVATRALLEYAKSNYNFSAAFNFSKVLSEAFKGAFVTKVIIGAIISIIIAAILGLIPIIGTAIAAYYNTVFFWSYVAEE